MIVSDKNLVKAALKVYARHLRGYENNEFEKEVKRVEELRDSEITSNSLVITIKKNI